MAQMAKQSTIKREILKGYPHDETMLIIRGYLSPGSNDVAAYIKVYELSVFGNLSMSPITKEFKVTTVDINNKINRIMIIQGGKEAVDISTLKRKYGERYFEQNST